jgi:hypothetical protein
MASLALIVDEVVIMVMAAIDLVWTWSHVTMSWQIGKSKERKPFLCKLGAFVTTPSIPLTMTCLTQGG